MPRNRVWCPWSAPGGECDASLVTVGGEARRVSPQWPFRETAVTPRQWEVGSQQSPQEPGLQEAVGGEALESGDGLG